ncbi:peptidoglycan-binding protein [Streptomyces sp. NPDC052095]|uniref:peptidoglycan-binding domain-containing protein n=1 Tax=unclassified Streptomyces TaxID=2593676 RepID=UPI00344BB968
MTGHICPECGTDNGPGGAPGHGSAPRPGCACGRTAAERDRQRYEEERHRAGRVAADRAEREAAEDFDPLRIRPYVTLGNDLSAPDAPRTGDPGRARPAEAVEGDAATTMPLRLGPATTGPLPDAVPTAAVPAFDASFGASSDAPGAAVRPDSPTAAVPAVPDEDGPSRRRRPFMAVATGVALIAVVGTAAFATGLLGGGDGGGDGDRVRALPSTAADLPGADADATDPAPPSGPASPTPSATASPSASASPSPSASATTEPSPSRPAAPPPPTTTAPSAPADSSPSDAPPASLAGPSLRPGDQGPAVADLQRRLAEVWLFHGSYDGDYSNRVERAVLIYQSYKSIEGDPAGVYGPRTRSALEAETTGRGPS